VLQAKVVDKIKQTFYVQYAHTHTKTSCLKYGRSGQATADDITQRMCFACWITNTRMQILVECLGLTAFPDQQWLYEHPSVLTHTLPVL
jgi:hypothetical protein